MKLTRKFTIGLIGGILIVQTAFAIVRVDRERELFRLDIAREEHVLGRSLAQNAEVVAASGGVDVARRLVERANVRDSHVEIRWVELDEGAAAVGRKVAGALVGTFLGVFVAYGFVAPMAGSVKSSIDGRGRYMQCIRRVLAASVAGVNPPMAVEMGRRSIYSVDRPSFEELEAALREERS